MAKTFIERLSNEQICTFLEKQFPKSCGYEFKYKIYKSPRGNVVILGDSKKKDSDTWKRFILGLYSTRGCSKEKWVNYLSSIYGDAYQQSYLENCSMIFD